MPTPKQFTDLVHLDPDDAIGEIRLLCADMGAPASARDYYLVHADFLGDIGPQGVQGVPGAIAASEYGFQIYNEDETVVPAGNYTVVYSANRAWTIERFYAEITHHSGTAEITIGVYVNGVLEHTAVVDESAPVEDTVSIAVAQGDTVVFAVLAVVGDVWGVWAQIDSDSTDTFSMPVTFQDEVTFSDYTHFPAGSAAVPSLQGPNAQGFHFPTDKVGISSLGVNWFRGGKDDLTLTMDTLLLTARTTGTPGHGYPQIALRNEDKTTRNGAGGFIRFQSYNSIDALIEAQINGGAVIATAGAEQSGFDFGGLRSGAYESMFAISAYELMVGPTVHNIYDVARSSYRFKAGWFSGPVAVGSFTVGTVPAAASYTGAMIYVSNETGGAVLAFSDGTNWRRVTDRNVIS